MCPSALLSDPPVDQDCPGRRFRWWCRVVGAGVVVGNRNGGETEECGEGKLHGEFLSGGSARSANVGFTEYSPDRADYLEG